MIKTQMSKVYVSWVTQLEKIYLNWFMLLHRLCVADWIIVFKSCIYPPQNIPVDESSVFVDLRVKMCLKCNDQCSCKWNGLDVKIQELKIQARRHDVEAETGERQPLTGKSKYRYKSPEAKRWPLRIFFSQTAWVSMALLITWLENFRFKNTENRFILFSWY